MARHPSLYRMLVVRIVLVALAASAVVSVLVIRREQTRLVSVARERALLRLMTFQSLVQEQLDQPGLGDHAEIRKMLAALASGGAELDTGRYVFIRVLDPSGTEVARLSDAEHLGLPELVHHARLQLFRQPRRGEGMTFNPVRIGGRNYLRMRMSLSDSRGRPAAVVEGYFSASPEAEWAARRNLLEAVALGVGIVVAVSLLLFPIILRLMRRLERLSLDLLEANLEMVGVVGRTIAKRDSDTDAHNFRVTLYAVRLAEALGLEDGRIRALIKGALLHDVGKIGIRDDILLKPGKLDEAEFREMKRHVDHGLDIVTRSAWLKEASDVLGGHHEKYGGEGYPAGLKGEEIPLLARIFAIVDVFDALASRRPYKEPLTCREAMEILARGRGTHFDPDLLDRFQDLAPGLHDRYGAPDSTLAQEELPALLKRYFQADLTALLG